MRAYYIKNCKNLSRVVKEAKRQSDKSNLEYNKT
jgi:hypothetical protein